MEVTRWAGREREGEDSGFKAAGGCEEETIRVALGASSSRFEPWLPLASRATGAKYAGSIKQRAQSVG